MKKSGLLLLSLLIIILSGGCKFIANTLKYRNETKEFMEDVLHKEDDKCIDLLVAGDYKDISRDTLKIGINNFRNAIVSNFGDHLDYTFMNSKKHITTDTAQHNPNRTEVMMQFSNGKVFGVLQVLFDDNSRKILDIKSLGIKEPIPAMTKFWLFGLLALCIPAFNIYMIVQVRKSRLKMKWLHYLAIILLNVPAITYNPIGGLSFSPFSFQVLLGVSFSYMGYLTAAWTFGIPLGGFFALWRIMRGGGKAAEEAAPGGQSVIDAA